MKLAMKKEFPHNKKTKEFFFKLCMKLNLPWATKKISIHTFE